MKHLYETIFDTTATPEDFMLPILRDLTGTEQIKFEHGQLTIHDAYWNTMLDEEFAQFIKMIKPWCSKLVISSTLDRIFPIAVDLEGFEIECKNIDIGVAWDHRVTLKNCKIKTDRSFKLYHLDIKRCTIEAGNIDFEGLAIDDFTIDAGTQFQTPILMLGYAGSRSGSNLMQSMLLDIWEVDAHGARVSISTDPIKFFNLKKNFKKYPEYITIVFGSPLSKGYILTDKSSIPKELSDRSWWWNELGPFTQYKILDPIRPYKYLYIGD